MISKDLYVLYHWLSIPGGTGHDLLYMYIYNVHPKLNIGIALFVWGWELGRLE